jgi:hypothetical protein
MRGKKIVFTICNTHLIFPELLFLLADKKKEAIPTLWNNNTRLLKAKAVARREGGIQSLSFSDMKT